MWYEEAESHSDTGHIAKIPDRVFVCEWLYVGLQICGAVAV